MSFVHLCIFLLSLTFESVSALMEFNFKPYDHPVLECITKIQTKYYQDHTIIITSTQLTSEQLFKFEPRTTAVLYTGKSLRFPGLFWKFHYFIFIINSSDEFAMILKSLYGTQLWNSRGRYVIGYFGNEDLSEMFQISWRYYIYNVDVVATDGNITNIYTYFPYKNQSCGEYASYDLLESCNSEIIGELFPEKVPLDYNACVIKFMAYPMIPYVLNINADREKPEEAGLEVTMLNVLGQRMNFTEMYIPHSHKFWGYQDLNGKYHFMFGSLYDKECDVILGMTFGNASHTVDFDGGIIHLIDFSIWWVPVALPIPQWKNLTAIFNGDVWLTILLVFLVNGFAWWFIGKSREPSHSYNDLVLSIMSSLYCLLQGSVAPPVTWKLRMVVLLWLITCLLIFTAHQCQLVSILTSPLYEHQIDSLEEVVNSSLKYGMFVGAALGFKDPTNWVHKVVYENYEPCPLSNYCVNRTAFKRDFAALRNERNARYFLPRYYTAPNGKLLVYPLDDNKMQIWARFHFTKGFPFLHRFDNLILRMQESGLVAKWDKEVSFYIAKLESDPEHEPLNINHLQGAFYVLVIGICIAIVVFVYEQIHNCKYNN